MCRTCPDCDNLVWDSMPAKGHQSRLQPPSRNGTLAKGVTLRVESLLCSTPIKSEDLVSGIAWGKRSMLVRTAVVGLGVWLSAALVASSAAGSGPIVFVDTNATGANDGSSWTDAYTEVQAALADARNYGGTVRAIWLTFR